MFDFTQSAHFAVVHNLQVDSTSSPLCSFLARFLFAAVHRLHTPPFSPDAQLRSQRASRVSPASSSTLNPLFVLSAHRLASCAKSRHCRSGLHELLSLVLFAQRFLFFSLFSRRSSSLISLTQTRKQTSLSRSICRHTSCIQ